MSTYVGEGRIELPLRAPHARVLPVYYSPSSCNCTMTSFCDLMKKGGKNGYATRRPDRNHACSIAANTESALTASTNRTAARNAASNSSDTTHK